MASACLGEIVRRDDQSTHGPSLRTTALAVASGAWSRCSGFDVTCDWPTTLRCCAPPRTATSCRSSCSTPHSGSLPATCAAPTSTRPCVPWTTRWTGRCTCAAATRSTWCARWPAVPEPPACTSPPTPGPTAADATAPWNRALAEADIDFVRTGMRLRRAPRRRAQAGRRPYSVFTPVQSGLARARLARTGAAAPTRRSGQHREVAATRSTTTPTSATWRCPRRARPQRCSVGRGSATPESRVSMAMLSAATVPTWPAPAVLSTT